MEWGFMFFFNSVLLGAGLAMDAFSVSMANGLNEPGMRKSKVLGIAGTFAGFQALLPMLGWLCVHTIAQYFSAFERAIPWISLILLAFIGGKMLVEGVRKRTENDGGRTCLGLWTLLVQGVATSIDALSVGFTIAEYDWVTALAASLIIAAVTFLICMAGLALGRRFGMKLSNKAQILGGVILIMIGMEIFVTGII